MRQKPKQFHRKQYGIDLRPKLQKSQWNDNTQHTGVRDDRDKTRLAIEL